MELNEKTISRKTILMVSFAAFLGIIMILAAVTLIMNRHSAVKYIESEVSISESSVLYESSSADLSSLTKNDLSKTDLSETDETAIYSEDASQTFAESISGDVSDISDISDISDLSDLIEESIEGWVINEYGYTYVYKDSGYEQFNFGTSTLERYIKSLNSIVNQIPETTRLFNITVPVSATFADIPSEVREADDYYNKSQSAFVATVASQLDERIINIPIVSLIEEKYNQGEYVFYRTDKNWTSLGAYTAYTAFCESSGISPHALSEFEQREVGEFLGSFYFATRSSAMEDNPDSVVCYSTVPSVKTSLTVYDSGLIYDNYTLCGNSISKYDAYNVFLGTVAERYEINTTADGGSLLIIGDSSAYPLVSFLASHYKKIDVIDPQYFNSSLQEFLENHQYDDVITMCYSTNAINGDYIPAFNTLTGAKADE